MFLLAKEMDEGGYKVDLVRGVERGAFCWRRKKDECGYKVDYGERGGESGCFC